MATEIKTLEPTQRLAITTQPQNYVAAFDNLARSDTLMGDLGATIAQQASIQYNRKMGLEYGLNPQGDLLPPITTADKAFQEGYIAQSKNTLSLQANQMFNQAEEELNKSYKLNQGQINEYQSQMSKGLEGIMKVAPTEVQTTLGYQYQAQLQNTTSELRKKLIGQSKSEALDTMRVNDKLTDQNINNLATSGKIDQASQIYQNKLAQNQRQYNSGMMTQAEKMASDTSAKITYYQGLYNNQLVNLSQQKKGETKESIDQKRGELLAQFADYRNRPKDISADEWTTLGNNTLAFEQHLQNMQNIQANFVMSALDVKATQGTLTNLDITSAANTPGVTDTRMNEWMAKFKQKQATQTQESRSTNNILTNYSDSRTWAETQSDKAKDAAYYQVVDSLNQQTGVPFRTVSPQPMQSEAQAAAMAGGPVPAFNRTISALSRTLDPTEMRSAVNAYYDVKLRSPGNLYGLDKNVVQRLEAFKAIRDNNPGMSDQEALQKVRVAETRDEKQKALIQENWQEQMLGQKGQIATYGDKVRKTREILGIKKGLLSIGPATPMLNENNITSNMMNIWKSNYDFVGDIEEAKSMTQETAKTIFGPSKVNGGEFVSMYPLEKMSGIENSHFFFQRDIAQQLTDKFQAKKDAFMKGEVSTYYRVKSPENYDLETMTQDKYNKIIKNAEPMVIETVGFKDGKEQVIDEADLITDISQETQLSYDPASPVSGDYDLALSHKNGSSFMLPHYGPKNALQMTYSPNFQKVKNEYTLMFSKFGSKPMSNTEEIMAYVEKLRGKVALPEIDMNLPEINTDLLKPKLPELNLNLPGPKEKKVDTKKHTYLF
jgi:hypothetical protein